MARKTVLIRMVRYAASPTGIYHADKIYEVSPELAKEFTTPHAITGEFAAYLQNESRLPETAVVEEGPTSDKDSVSVPSGESADIPPTYPTTTTTQAPKP